MVFLVHKSVLLRTNMQLISVSRILLVLALMLSGSAHSEGVTGAPTNPVKADAGTILRTLQDHLSNTFDARNFGVKCDGLELTDVSTTASSPTISSLSYTFTTKDIGKTIVLYGSSNGALILPGDATITAVNGSQATLSSDAIYSGNGTIRAVFYKTDNTSALATAINYVSSVGGGHLKLPSGVCAASNVVLKRQVILQGESRNSTVLFQIAGSNQDFVTSENFAALTGTGLNYGDNASHNGIQSDRRVPSWFGLKHLRVDGNRYRQSVAGNCVSFYGNAQIFDSTLVMNCSKNGQWTEASSGYAYSPNDWKAAEEGFMNDMIVRNVQDNGWVMRGPHDSIVTSYLAYAWGGSGTGYGFKSEASSTYLGSAHFWHIHPYTSDGAKTSIYIGAGNSDIQFLYSDFGTTTIPSGHNKIGAAYILGCGFGNQSPCVNITGDYNVISQMNLSWYANGTLPTGLVGLSIPVGADLNSIQITASGTVSTTANNTLVQVRGNFNEVKGVLSNTNGTGNVCADLGGSYNSFDFRTFGCKTHLLYTAGGFHNEVKGRHYVVGGETGLTGTINSADSWVYDGTAIRFNNGPAGSVTNPGLTFGGFTANGFYASSNSIGLGIAGVANSVWNASGLTVPAGSVVIGTAGTTKGSLGLTGNTSGTITISPQATAGTYNFNLPTTAGTAGQPLLSGGGASAPMTWGAKSGSTTTFATTSGTLTSNQCAKFDASGNLVASGASCAGTTPGNSATQFDYGAVCDGTTDDTSALQAWVSSGKTLRGVAGTGKCRVTGTLTFNTANQKYVGQGAQFTWTANSAASKVISIAADGVHIDGIWMDNPNEITAQTGNHYGAIYVEASNFKITNSHIEKFMDGILQAPSDTNRGFTAENNTIKDVLGAGNGSGSDPQVCGTGLDEGCGEDRGDGITCWGQDCKIIANTINCKAGNDCRIGVHGENLSHPSPKHYNFTFVGNIVTGPFRRAVACEATDNCNISDNVGKGQTWWSVTCINTNNCGGTGNKFYFDRLVNDSTGSSWGPVKGPLYVYGKAQNTSFDASNQFIVTGYADYGGILKGVSSGDLRGANNFIGAQFIGNDLVSKCVSVEYQDGATVSASCRGFKDYGIYSYDVSKQNYSSNYFDSVNKYQTKLVTGSITGSFTVGETITGGTSGTTGTLLYVDSVNKLLTIQLVSGTAYTVAETVTGGTSSASAAVSSINKYGTCILDQDNTTTSVAGKYDNNQCFNHAKGIEIPSKNRGSVQNWKFENVTTAVDLFSSTYMIAKNHVYSGVTTNCANCGGTGNDLGAGGAGIPGGTNGQIQYNNAGSFGGVTAVPIANGGTGNTTASAAINALVPTQTGQGGKVLQTDGTSASWQSQSCTTTTVTFDGGSTGLTFSAPITVCGGSPGPIVTTPVTKTTDYTLVLADTSNYIRMNCSTTCLLTIPTNASAAFSIGQEIAFEQVGIGSVTVTAASGVTLNTYSGVNTAGRYATAALKKTGTDTWTLTGNVQ